MTNKLNFFVLVFLFANLLVNAQSDVDPISEDTSKDGKEETARYARLIQESYNNGDYELQKSYSDSLFMTSERYGFTDMSIMALNSQAVYYKNKSSKQKALELYYMALERCKLIPNNVGPKLMILVNMGNMYTNIGSYEKSIETMDQVLALTDTIARFKKIKMTALLGQASNYTELQKFEEALQIAQHTLELGMEMQSEEVVGTAYSNISNIYIEQEEYANALIASEKGLALQELKRITKKRAGLLLNNGIANYRLGNVDEALMSFEEALEIALKKEVPDIEMKSHKYRAKIYEDKKEFEKSYEAQREYSRLLNLVQGDVKEAVIVDLEKEISTTKEVLDEVRAETETTTENKNKLLLYGGAAVLSLIGLLFFYIKKKNNIELENRDLQDAYTLLKGRIDNSLATSSDSEVNNIMKAQEPYKNSSLTETGREEYRQQIVRMMKEEKPYLDADLSLSELASKLEMSTAHFSEVLHYCFNENFYNLINFYRVVEAQDLLKKSSYQEEKIITVAFDSGFKSKTTFNRVFKNYTGQTPSEYRKTS